MTSRPDPSCHWTGFHWGTVFHWVAAVVPGQLSGSDPVEWLWAVAAEGAWSLLAPVSLVAPARWQKSPEQSHPWSSPQRVRDVLKVYSSRTSERVRLST